MHSKYSKYMYSQRRTSVKWKSLYPEENLLH